MAYITDLVFLFSLFWTSLIALVMSQTQLTDEDKQAILKFHNTLRGIVGPTATNMLLMVRHDLAFKIKINLYIPVHDT